MAWFVLLWVPVCAGMAENVAHAVRELPLPSREWF